MSKVNNEKEVKKTWKKKIHEELYVTRKAIGLFWNNLKGHPEMIGSAIASLVPIIGGAIMFIGNQKEKAEDNCRIHDEQTGFDWNTTHELTNQELLKVNKRLYDEQIKGLGEALEAEGYLKKEKKRR